MAFHLNTIWLFTASDIKSVVIPETLLGVSTALTGPLLTTNSSPKTVDVLKRIPRIILWNWLSLLFFDIDNQFQAGSIVEDTVNKPWRLLPSGRLTASEARHLLILVIPIVIIGKLYLGGTAEASALMIGSFVYNYLQGADESFLFRNLLNAGGYICYSSGSMKVATGHGQYELNVTAATWLAIIGVIIATTLQMQDMPEDTARGRRTIPVLYGDKIARFSIAIPVISWSLICAIYWELNWAGCVKVGLSCAVFDGRLLLLRTQAADGVSWKFWCVWMVTVYLLPLLGRSEILA